MSFKKFPLRASVILNFSPIVVKKLFPGKAVLKTGGGLSVDNNVLITKSLETLTLTIILQNYKKYKFPNFIVISVSIFFAPPRVTRFASQKNSVLQSHCSTPLTHQLLTNIMASLSVYCLSDIAVCLCVCLESIDVLSFV